MFWYLNSFSDLNFWHDIFFHSCKVGHTYLWHVFLTLYIWFYAMTSNSIQHNATTPEVIWCYDMTLQFMTHNYIVCFVSWCYDFFNQQQWWNKYIFDSFVKTKKSTTIDFSPPWWIATEMVNSLDPLANIMATKMTDQSHSVLQLE